MEQITDEQIEKAREVELSDFLGLKMRGRSVMIRCPFHGEKTPSCSISRKGLYHCFGCGVGGQGTISFLMELGDTFQEAVIRLTK